MNALFLESGAAKDRDELDQAGEAADRSLKNGNRNGFLFENELRDCIVLVGYGIDEFGQRRFRAILVSGRNLGDFVLQAFVGEVALAPNDGLLVDHVDDAGEFVFSSDVQEDRERIGTELFAHVGQRVVKIGTGAVHLVDERDPGHFVLGGLAPDRLGLGLDTGYTAKHSDRAVQNTHGTFDFSGEVDVSRCIDDVNPMSETFEVLVKTLVLLLGPEGGHRRRGDGDAALLFLFHPVGDSVAVIDVADLVDQACVEENSLGRCGLARIDVGANTKVTSALQWVLAQR